MPWRTGDRDPRWGTPWPLFLEIQRRFGWGGYTIDPCAEEWSAKCPRFYTAEDDGLSQPWGTITAPGRAFINPDFSDIGPWFREALAKLRKAEIELATFLVPARTGMPWWHEVVLPFCSVVWCVGRVEFLPPPDYTGPVTSHGEDMVVCNMGRALEPRALPKVTMEVTDGLFARKHG